MVTRACPTCRKPVMLPASGTFLCPHCEHELRVVPAARRKTSGAEIGMKIGLGILAAGVALAILGALLKSL